MVYILDGCTRGVNQVFRFVEGIWLHRKSRQIFHSCATISELPSYIPSIMPCTTVIKVFLLSILYTETYFL